MVQPLLRARSWLPRSPAQPTPGARPGQEEGGCGRVAEDGCCLCSRRLSQLGRALRALCSQHRALPAPQPSAVLLLQPSRALALH